jgi:probable F420-dependent oxidoreductase
MAAGDKADKLGLAVRSLGRYGVWRGGREMSPDLAKAIEQLGYGALWIGGSPNGELKQIEELLSATTTLVLATGIVNIWQDDAATVARSYHRIEARFPGRFLLGIGTGHPEAIESYAKPFEAISAYVDALVGDGVPPGSVALAALGPRVLRLAAERTAGAHPYLVTPEHTRQARDILGTGPLLAPEQKVVLGDDPAAARAIGRPRVEKPYLGLQNYTSNLRRLGWTDEDMSNGGSDALIDALVAHGTPAQAAGRLREHLDAGADHVCVQLLTAPGEDLVTGYRQLAGVLGL